MLGIKTFQLGDSASLFVLDPSHLLAGALENQEKCLFSAQEFGALWRFWSCLIPFLVATEAGANYADDKGLSRCFSTPDDMGNQPTCAQLLS